MEKINQQNCVKYEEIKCFHCADEPEYDLLAPGSLESFELYFEMNIGAYGSPASEIFGIMVLSSDIDTDDYVDQKRIVIPFFDPELIEYTIAKIVEYCNRKRDPLAQLRLFFNWEYEGYQ